MGKGAQIAGGQVAMTHRRLIQCVPLATEPGISLIILPLMRILQRNLKRTTNTFLFISHTTNALLFKFHCNIFIGVTIIKEMPGSVASGIHCIYRPLVYSLYHVILLAPTDLTCPDFWTICLGTEETRHKKHHPTYVNLTPSCRQRFNPKIRQNIYCTRSMIIIISNYRFS